MLAFHLLTQKIIIVECKPEFSSSDVNKLHLIRDRKRLNLLSKELKQRGYEKKFGIIIPETGIDIERVITCVSFKGQLRELKDIYQIAFNLIGFETNLTEVLD